MVVHEKGGFARLAKSSEEARYARARDLSIIAQRERERRRGREKDREREREKGSIDSIG